MPCIRVSVDGTPIVDAATRGVNHLGVSVRGERSSESYSILDVSGWTYSQHYPHLDHFWLESLPLRSGQIVTVSLLEDESHATAAVRTVEVPFNLDRSVIERRYEQRLAETRAARILRDAIAFKMILPTGASKSVATLPREHGCNFWYCWWGLEPDRADVWLSSFDLEVRPSVDQDSGGNGVVKETVPLGSEVRLVLGD
jgi:hypothetical protein